MLADAHPIMEDVPGAFVDPVSLAAQQAAHVTSLIVARYDGDDGGSGDDATTSGDGAPTPPLTKLQVPLAGGRWTRGAADGPEGSGDGTPLNSPPYEAVSPAGGGGVPRSGEGVSYDAFVAASGQLLAVAHCTPAFRFATRPAVALGRYAEAKRNGRPLWVSVYALAPAACTRFLESVFYQECLKLHVTGAESAFLAAEQLRAAACAHAERGGLVEANDFSDPARPVVRLVELAELIPDGDGGSTNGDAREDDALTAALATLLDGVHGRLLLYDRHRNAAVAADRCGEALDFAGAVAEARRLAEAARHEEPRALLPLARTEAARETAQEAIRGTLAAADGDSAEGTAVAVGIEAPPAEPAAVGLAALVGELQGGPAAGALTPFLEGALPDLPPETPARPPAGAPAEAPPPITDAAPEETASTGDAGNANNAGNAGPASITPPTPPPLSPLRRGSPAQPGGGPGRCRPSTPLRTGSAAEGSPPPSPAPDPQGPHPFGVELDRLRVELYALLEDAVGRDKAHAHSVHVCSELGVPAGPAGPADPEHALPYLRALLTADPPRRWHGFKRLRAKTFEEAARKVHALFASVTQDERAAEHPDAQELTKLWARLHR